MTAPFTRKSAIAYARAYMAEHGPARRDLGESTPARQAVRESAPLTPPTKPMHELSETERDAYAAQVAEQAVFGHMAEDEAPAVEQEPAALDLEPSKPLHLMTDEERWLYEVHAVESQITFGGRR